MTRRRNKNSKDIPAQSPLPTIHKADKFYWLFPCFLAGLLFVPAIHFGFVFDDNTLIMANPWVHSWSYFPKLLTSHLWAFRATAAPILQYRPAFSVWLLTLYTIGEHSTIFWHVSNIVLHITSTYFVFRLCRELLGSEPAACWAAVLFAIHPIHVEPVCWIASCNELLYTSAVLCSLLLFWCGLRKTTDKQFYIWTSTALWGVAIFTKESALPVLAVFFYLSYCASDKTPSWWQRIYEATRQAVAYFGVVVLYFIARFAFVGGIGLAVGRHSWKQVIYSAPSIIAFYMEKLLLPVRLSSFYLNPLSFAPTTKIWLAAALIVIGIVALTWMSVTHSSAWGVASMLLFLPMLPVLVGIRLFLVGDLAHDRYMYLPSVGICIFGGLAAKYALSAPVRVKHIARIAGYAIAVVLAVLTISQEGIYASDQTYFGRGVEANPNNYLARDYLGDFYLVHRNMDLAIPQFQEAHKLAPYDSFSTFCLARGLFEDKQFSAAEPYLKGLADANQLDERIPKGMVLLALGQTEINLKNLSYAETVLSQLDGEDETYPGLHRTMGTLYLIDGKIPIAQTEFAREFQVSGDPASEKEAVELGNLIREGTAATATSRTGVSR